MSRKDYYYTLKIPRTATHDQIRSAYRNLAREYHPDLNKSPLAENRFKAINEAYEILGNPAKRAEYDDEHLALQREGVMYTRTTSQNWKKHSPEGGADPSPRPNDSPKPGTSRPKSGPADGTTRTSFREFMGGKKTPPKPESEPLEVRLALSLEEAALGGTHDISINLPELGGMRSYQVRVPAACLAGQKIRIMGQGGHRYSQHIDLIVELLPHSRFRLEERDLHTVVPITPWEAALGCRCEITTLTGRVMAHIPAHSSSGRRVRLRGLGFPAALGETPGDLLVELRIMMPDKLTEDESRLFTKLAAVSSFNPRT